MGTVPAGGRYRVGLAGYGARGPHYPGHSQLPQSEEDRGPVKVLGMQWLLTAFSLLKTPEGLEICLNGFEHSLLFQGS